jgi:ribosome-binding protein aMBF1 (putative translation factor)
MRLSHDFLERLDAWRQRQPDLPSRAESIRRLTTALLQIFDKNPDDREAKPNRRDADLRPGLRPRSDLLIQNILNRPGSQANRNSTNLKPAMITIRQIKAARALLGWSQSDLAQHSSVSEPTIARLESTDGELGGRGETVRKIRAALETSGIEFTEGNGTGEGVRFEKPHRSRRK